MDINPHQHLTLSQISLKHKHHRPGSFSSQQTPGEQRTQGIWGRSHEKNSGASCEWWTLGCDGDPWALSAATFELFQSVLRHRAGLSCKPPGQVPAPFPLKACLGMGIFSKGRRQAGFRDSLSSILRKILLSLCTSPRKVETRIPQARSKALSHLFTSTGFPGAN